MDPKVGPKTITRSYKPSRVRIFHLGKHMAKSYETDAVLFSKGRSSTNVAPSSKSKEEGSSAEEEGDTPTKKPVTCFRCGKPGHVKEYRRVKLSKANVACTSEEDDQLNWDHCFMVEAIEQKDTKDFVNFAYNKEEWIIDSGCSHHVTGNETLFSETREHLGDRVIVTADNSTHPVTKGVVEIDVAGDARSKGFKLDDVYLVPGLTKNLVSVPQITESGKYVLFGPKDVKVLVNVKEISADVVFFGEKKGTLYVMSAGEAYVKKTNQTNNATIWHAWLGHVGYQNIAANLI